ncbi:MAG TPA: hypothetical protein P5081_17765 [Phycisphaerae bacterium]|nr:hypothetical protein [Phycisphaerae bacterium]HRW54719.1 hypothetical protein [Phycisphaerae bacterium]
MRRFPDPRLLVVASACIFAGCRSPSQESTTTAEAAWARYEASTGLFSFAYPPDWRIVLVGDVANIVKEDAGAAFAVSARRPDVEVGDRLAELIERPFAGKTPTSELKPITYNGWSGYRRTWGESDGKEWMGAIAYRGGVCAFVSVNAKSEAIATARPIFDRLVESLTLAD